MPSSPQPPIVHVAKKSTADAVAMEDGTNLAQRTVKGHGETYKNGLQGKTFVQKIHSLLTIPKYSSIISWNDAGTAVTIHDADAFISTVVPAHFKATKFGSFIRKMRRWGFSVVTKKSSPSATPTSSEVEFKSEHFLRDQPNRCLLMKDERHVKKQFSFLDDVKKINYHDMKRSEGSSVGYCFKQPQSLASKVHTGGNQSNTQQQSTADSSEPLMGSPNQYSYQNAMPMMNNRMMHPPPSPPHQYQNSPFGYGPPPEQGYSFPYHAADGQSPSYSQQQYLTQLPQQLPQHQMLHQYQMQRDHQSYGMMHQHQHLPPPQRDYMNLHNGGMMEAVADAASPSTYNGVSDTPASAAGENTGVVSSSSGESSELVTNTNIDLNVHVYSQLNT